MIDKIFEECRKVNEEYKPYTGGAGPSEEQVRKNNAALKVALEREGIQTKFTTTDFDGSLDEPIEVLEIAPGVTISYDRWGFVGEGGEGDLDQGDLDDAVAWTKRNAGVNR